MAENFDGDDLIFEERCEFCDDLLEFQNVYIVLLSDENRITMCENCYHSVKNEPAT